MYNYLMLMLISAIIQCGKTQKIDSKINLLANALLDILQHQKISQVILFLRNEDKHESDVFLLDKLITQFMLSKSTITYEIINVNSQKIQQKNTYAKDQRFTSIVGSTTLENTEERICLIYSNIYSFDSNYIQSTRVTTLIITNRNSIMNYAETMKIGNKVILLSVDNQEECLNYLHYNFKQCFNTSILQDREIHMGYHSHSNNNINYEIIVLSLETDQLETVGNWNKTDGLTVVKDNLWKINKFRNKTFIIVTTSIPTFHYKKSEGTWAGVCIDLLDRIATIMNFTYRIVEPIDDKWGSVDDNGTWNGMVGMLHRKQVDIGVAKFTIGIQRDQVVDFTIPFWQEPVAMMMKKQYETTAPIYISPFKNEVWICLICSVILMSVVFFIFIYIRSRIYDLSGSLVCIRHFKPGEVLFICFGIFFNQGMLANRVYFGPKASSYLNFLIWNSFSIRILIVSWAVFGFILLTTYTANLTAFLTVQKINKPIKSLEHLLSQNEYKLSVLDSGGLNLAMKTSKGGVTARLWQHSVKDKENRAETPSKGAESTKYRPLVFLVETSWAINYVYNDCDVTLGDQFPFDSLYGFALQENSPYLNDFNRILLRLIDEGWVNYYYNKHQAKDKCLSNDIRVSHNSIQLVKLQRMLTIGGGFVFSWLFIFLLEGLVNIIHKLRQYFSSN